MENQPLRVEWAGTAINDLLALDKAVAGRVKASVTRLADSGTADVKRLKGIHPPEFRPCVGDYRVRFQNDGVVITVLRVLNRREAIAKP